MSDEKIWSFEEAREFVRNLNFCSVYEWKYAGRHLCPDDIPDNPEIAYKESGWSGWNDFLCGPDCTSRHKFILKWLPYKFAKAYMQLQKIQSHEHWRDYSKTDRPCFIPSAPDIAYKNCGWESWTAWLGTSRKKKERKSFNQARKFARSLDIKSSTQWRKHAKSGLLPEDIPYNPDRYYADHWNGWSDWLGNENNPKSWRDYNEAKEYAQSLGLANFLEWTRFCKSDQFPKDIPTAPNVTYKKNGWTNWGDWLGTGRSKVYNWLSYEEAKQHVRSLGLKSHSEWSAYCMSGAKPNNIPKSPHSVYKKSGWVSWSDWLGRKD